MNSLVHNSPSPYYQQLYAILRKEIVDGRWLPGDMLPSETELIEQFEVSRITVRQALEMLVNDGLIFRRRGRGTFVAVPKIEQGLSRIVSFTEDMRRRGLHPGTEILAAGLESADQDVADKLQISEGEELVHIERLRLADAEPLSIEISHLVHRYCPGVLDHDYAEVPLREQLAASYNIALVRAEQVIRAIAAPKEIADKLLVAAGSPLFYIERISYSQRDIPVEFLQLYYRGDRYTLFNELKD